MRKGSFYWISRQEPKLVTRFDACVCSLDSYAFESTPSGCSAFSNLSEGHIKTWGESYWIDTHDPLGRPNSKYNSFKNDPKVSLKFPKTPDSTRERAVHNMAQHVTMLCTWTRQWDTMSLLMSSSFQRKNEVSIVPSNWWDGCVNDVGVED